MFENRQEAGRRLAQILPSFIKETVVVAIPRGGVVVGKEIARFHEISLDIIVVRKIGAPDSPEFSIGAVAPSGTTYIGLETIEKLQISKEQLNTLVKQVKNEQATRQKFFNKARKKQSLKGKQVVLVDDGIATGATIIAALLYLKKQHVEDIIIAVPVIAKDVYKMIINNVTQIVALSIPERFNSVGGYYSDFKPVEDEEVVQILKQKD
jgi:putative phosphoribosyl transferase